METVERNTFKMKLRILIFIVCISFSCKHEDKNQIPTNTAASENEIITQNKTVFEYDLSYIADSFDFPVGKPNAHGYYNAQKFQENRHLGDDWNAVTGGNSDLGDPIYAIANGYIKLAQNYGGGWGNVIRIIHKMPNGQMVESLYAHCDTIFVKEQQWVTKGTTIGTIGNADGQYLAHLHFEIRDDLTLPIGPGYADITKGYLNPTKFINAHR